MNHLDRDYIFHFLFEILLLLLSHNRVHLPGFLFGRLVG